MRFAVIGAGGAGGYFGARLANAGHDVAFVARGAHLTAMCAFGLRVDSIAGDIVVRPAHATGDPTTIGAVDCVLMGVKAWQVTDAARTLGPLLHATTAVVPLQNGVEAASQIAAVIGGGHTLGGAARIISFLLGPGHIKHTGASPTLEVGELDGSKTARLERLREAFAQTTGVALTVPPDIHVAIWTKFLFLASLAGVGAMARASIGRIRSEPGLRRMLEDAMDEIEHVARAREIRLTKDVHAEVLAFVDRLPADGTTSLQRDIAKGVPSELESLSGAVVRLGREAGIPTPTHASIYEALVPLERRARGLA